MAKIKHKTNKSKRVSRFCCNNNACSFCRSNRTYASKKRIVESLFQMKENCN